MTMQAVLLSNRLRPKHSLVLQVYRMVSILSPLIKGRIMSILQPQLMLRLSMEQMYRAYHLPYSRQVLWVQ